MTHYSNIKRVVTVLALVLFFGAAVTGFLSVMRVKPAMAEISGQPVIIIDAGHPDSINIYGSLRVNISR